jgi:hypothetical protein
LQNDPTRIGASLGDGLAAVIEVYGSDIVVGEGPRLCDLSLKVIERNCVNRTGEMIHDRELYAAFTKVISEVIACSDAVPELAENLVPRLFHFYLSTNSRIRAFAFRCFGRLAMASADVFPGELLERFASDGLREIEGGNSESVANFALFFQGLLPTGSAFLVALRPVMIPAILARVSRTVDPNRMDRIMIEALLGFLSSLDLAGSDSVMDVESMRWFIGFLPIVHEAIVNKYVYCMLSQRFSGFVTSEIFVDVLRALCYPFHAQHNLGLPEGVLGAVREMVLLGFASFDGGLQELFAGEQELGTFAASFPELI